MNVGCIPSKSLLNNSHLYHTIKHDTEKRGIKVGDLQLDLKQMMSAKESSVNGLTKGIEFLFKKNKVDYVPGTASFVDENTVAVNLIDGGQKQLRGKNIIVATGSEATPFPGLTIDEKKVITSTGAIALEQVPKKLSVIGGGIIGLEMVRNTWNTSTLTNVRLQLRRRPFGRVSEPRSQSLNSLDRLVAQVWMPRSASRPRRFCRNRD